MQVIRCLRPGEQLINGCVVCKDPSGEYTLDEHVRDGSIKSRFTSFSLFQPHETPAGKADAYDGITGGRQQVIQQLYDKAAEVIIVVGNIDASDERVKCLYTKELARANGVKGIAAGWAVHSREICLDNMPLPVDLLVNSTKWESVKLTRNEDYALRTLIATKYGWDYADDAYGKYFFSAQNMAFWLCVAIDERNNEAATACAKRLQELWRKKEDGR